MQDRDNIAAIFYVLIVVIGTLVYANSDHIDRLRHPIDALSALWNDTGDSDQDSE
ncbi:MAG TPA: hypothetical protein VFA53_00135 [Xanthobacteraceae bacterium]|nr:hypothetical protein [Xanthobacteraceae bacterium]